MSGRRIALVVGVVVVIGIIGAQSQSGAAPSQGASGGGSPAATPGQAPGTIVFDQASYSCASSAAMTFHVVMSDKAGALSVQLVMAKMDSRGGETVVGAPVSVAISRPDIIAFDDGPVPVADICGGLDPADYVFRVVSSDGSKTLAEGRTTLTP